MSEITVSAGEVLSTERFFDLYDRMLGNVSIPDVLQDVTNVVCHDLKAERATIYLIDKETEELVSAALIGNVTQTIRVPIRESSLAGYCALTGKPFIVPDAYGDLSNIDSRLKFDQRWDSLNRFRTKDVMCAPATFKGEVLGVVQVINSKAGLFNKGCMDNLKSVSRLIGYALYHARLYDDLLTMKRLEKEKAEFMQIMVHELKSPAAAAKMMADVLKDTDFHDPRIAELPIRISDRMDHLLNLAEEILVLAKVKSGEPLGKIEILDLANETRQVCTPYRDQAESKGMEFELDAGSKILPIRFDSQGLNLVLSNLLSNAIKYTPAGAVRVSVQEESGWAVLKVQDSGIGIPKEDVPRLFKEFFRASNAKQQQVQGSGVGLSGVKRIIERFGGNITLETRENSGSTFTVQLPISVA